jgi:hypothetical protein
LKQLLLLVVFFSSLSAAKSQDLIFNINQAGSALKDSKTGVYDEAEVKDTRATIVLKNNQVTVQSEKLSSYTLVDNGIKTKFNSRVVAKKWKSTDEENLPMHFAYRLNTHTKEALVELTYKKVKSFYFGTYSTIDLVGKN